MSDTRLSVIIPGYNTSSVWWKRCLISVLCCCQQEDEIICVDDGSRRAANLTSFAREDCRVRILFRKNGGLSIARNTGMAVAKGAFLTFVDSDDEIIENIFQYCLDKLFARQGDVAVYGVRTVWVEEGLRKEDCPAQELSDRLSPSEVKGLQNSDLLNYACNKVYRTSFLRSHCLKFLPKGMPCEDIIFNLSVIMAGSRWVNVPRVGYVYYRTGDTLLSCYIPFNAEGRLLGAQAWADYAKTSCESQELFARQGVISQVELLWAEWENMNRNHSPYGPVAKLIWLMKRRTVLSERLSGQSACLPRISLVLFCILEVAKRYVKRYLYLRPIRRWHRRRVSPYTV